ncbi:hypothetical protein DRP05_12490 [Archaeoglobales archaeon]|nr:MAG: hypothetical protein DRP05_12490 [Archaeoglobales archaeon]
MLPEKYSAIQALIFFSENGIINEIQNIKKKMIEIDSRRDDYGRFSSSEDGHQFAMLRNKLLKILDEFRYPLERTDNPLLGYRRFAYRVYNNTKEWECYFCGDKIFENEGYWAHSEMVWSQGPKLCNTCFLKFLSFIEHNDRLMELLSIFEKVDGYDILLLRMRDWSFVYLVKELATNYDLLLSAKGDDETQKFVNRIIDVIRKRYDEMYVMEKATNTMLAFILVKVLEGEWPKDETLDTLKEELKKDFNLDILERIMYKLKHTTSKGEKHP